jgi:hypothetical protein
LRRIGLGIALPKRGPTQLHPTHLLPEARSPALAASAATTISAASAMFWGCYLKIRKTRCYERRNAFAFAYLRFATQCSAQTMYSADCAKAVVFFLARPFSDSHVTFSCSQPWCRLCEAPKKSHITPASPKDAPPAATQHDMDVVDSWFAS